MSSAPPSHLPLDVAALVRSRCDELSITKTDLVQRLGYSNISKGLRRLKSILAGELPSAQARSRMPVALEIDGETYEAAVEQTRRTIMATNDANAARVEAEWRAAFQPHAIILTERRIPSPIFAALAIGVERLLRIDLDGEASKVTFRSQALTGLRARLEGGMIPCFGRPTGYVVNFSPDTAVEFNLSGEPVETLDAAYRIDASSLQLERTGRLLPSF